MTRNRDTRSSLSALYRAVRNWPMAVVTTYCKVYQVIKMEYERGGCVIAKTPVLLFPLEVMPMIPIIV